MSLPRPKPSITTTAGLHASRRCDGCGERADVRFLVNGKQLCGECHPRGAEIIRVVQPE